jgi:N-acetylneuraminic acid mutarotase
MMMRLSLLSLAVAMLGGSAGGQELAWKEVAELPQPVAGYMAGVIQSRLVVAGGTYWENGQKHWSASVRAFDPYTNTWTMQAPLPSPRSDAASASLHGDLYVLGGGADSNVSRDALMFHRGKWRAVPQANLPEPRLFASAIAMGGYIYILGGTPKAGDYSRVANSFWRWRPGMRRWEILPALPGPGRISHAMAEIDGSIFVLGGATSAPQGVENLRDVYAYRPQDRAWTRLPDLLIANRAWSAVGLQHRAIILGGYTDDFSAAVYSFAPGEPLRQIGSLPHALADAKFFRIGNLILGAGGEAGPGVRGKWTFQAPIPVAGMKNR